MVAQVTAPWASLAVWGSARPRAPRAGAGASRGMLGLLPEGAANHVGLLVAEGPSPASALGHRSSVGAPRPPPPGRRPQAGGGGGSARGTSQSGRGRGGGTCGGDQKT